MNEEFAVFSNKIVKYLNDATIVARLSHWNVRGSNFYEAHLMFERIYNDLGDQMDSLVEQLRACGFNPDFDMFKGPGISMEYYDCHSTAELILDYVMALDGTIALFYAFCEKNKQDPRLVAIGNQMQAMSSVVLRDMYLLQSYLA
jgi:DNA-binding ferritin-like protein